MKRRYLLLLLCLWGAPVAHAAIESQGFVLDQPTFNYGSSSSSAADTDLYGTVGAGGLSDSLNSQSQIGAAERVLPSPDVPILQVVGGSSLRIVVTAGSNDRYVDLQVELATSGQAENLDADGKVVAGAWTSAAIWQDGVTVRDLPRNRTYSVRARARAEDSSVSDWSRTADVSIGQPLVGGGWLPEKLTNKAQEWYGTPTGQAISKLLDRGLTPVLVATIATQAIAAASLLGQLLLDLILKLITGVSPLFQYLVFFRRKRPYGRVIDGRSHQPLSGVLVAILRPDTKTVIETQQTDQSGRYLFTTDERTSYILRVEASEHDVYERLCRGAAVNRLVSLGLSLEYNPKKLHRRQRTDRVIGILNAWRLPLLLVGTVMWLMLYLRDGGFVFWLGLYYILAWSLELFIRTQPAPFGIVADSMTKLPIGTAVVRLYGGAGRLVQTMVTNNQGRFSTLLRTGDYEMQVSARGYETVRRPRARFTRRGSLQAIRVDLKPLA